MEKTMTKNALVWGLILLAVFARLIPHPANFTPIMAIALFAGALLPARLALVVPLAAIALSDLVLGHAFGAMTLVVLAALALGALLGRCLARNRTWTRTFGAALAGSIVFFVLTNFAVWALPGAHAMYPLTIAGLVECYVMAIPF